MEGADFAGPGPRVEEEVQKGIIPEAFVAFHVDHLEETEDLLLVKETDEGLLGALRGDGEDRLRNLLLLGVEEAEHLGEGLDGGQALIDLGDVLDKVDFPGDRGFALKRTFGGDTENGWGTRTDSVKTARPRSW
jgi:hypothetical protein